MPRGENSRKSAIVGAVFCFCVGILFLVKAHYAQIHHTFIPGSGKYGRITPAQGYYVAIGFFVVCMYGAILAIRARKP